MGGSVDINLKKIATRFKGMESGRKIRMRM